MLNLLYAAAYGLIVTAQAGNLKEIGIKREEKEIKHAHDPIDLLCSYMYIRVVVVLSQSVLSQATGTADLK